MSFFLADATGPISDFASIGGLSAFNAWAKKQKGPVADFARDGYTTHPVALAAALVDSAPSSLEELAATLQSAAKDADEILILTDGMSHIDSDLRSASRKRTNELHDAANSCLKPMGVAIRYAFARGRAAVDVGALKSATSIAQASLATAKAPDAVRSALQEVYPPTLKACVKAGGDAGVTRLHSLRIARRRETVTFVALAPPLQMAFNVDDPNVLEWAKDHAAELISGVTETTREDIAAAIVAAFDPDSEDSSRDAFDAILDSIGDDARAEMILQTEVMTAVNEGQRESWAQAVDNGLLTGDEKREWIASDGCCDDCDQLDGETADLDGDYPDDGGDGPPLHPRCGCTEGISADT